MVTSNTSHGSSKGWREQLPMIKSRGFHGSSKYHKEAADGTNQRF